MIFWISSEANMSVGIDLNHIYMQIEKYINTHLKEIGYKNEKITKLRIVIVLRDDDFSVMRGGQDNMQKTRGKLIYGINSRIDYYTFKNATQEQRANLILDLLLKSLTLLEEKGIKDLEVVKEFIESCKFK